MFFLRLNEECGSKINPQHFNDYELIIASHIVVPSEIKVSWSDIAGLDTVISEIQESVVLPVRHRYLLNSSKLWQAPKGVLLHGPPGCGKTLIAKATAKEGGMRFINLDVAILTDKWYGESQKLASAVFSLALKIQPCIIFIDEIDSLLRSRNSNDHEVTAMMKTQFMMLWDGLSTNSHATVIVMGATNRPQDLDKAILRRMPAQFHIGLPNAEQRHKILKLILSNETLDETIDFQYIAQQTVGFSGADLMELCRHASVYCVRRFMRSQKELEKEETQRKENTNDITVGGVSALNVTGTSFEATYGNLDKIDNKNIGLTLADIMESFKKMKESKTHTGHALFENRIELD